jgi:hypothetical protein
VKPLGGNNKWLRNLNKGKRAWQRELTTTITGYLVEGPSGRRRNVPRRRLTCLSQKVLDDVIGLEWSLLAFV